MGYLLDNNPGSEGRYKIFWVLSLFAVLGFLASLSYIFINKSRAEVFEENSI